MAEKRMFAKTIIDSDAFLDMPISTRLLYYDLAMRADDDGFVNSPKKIMRVVGATVDDINILAARKFIIPFEKGVVVIKHWKIHNYIRKDAYHETKYKEEKAQLEVDENGAYRRTVTGALHDCNEVVTNLSTQIRLDKNSIEENSIDKSSKDKGSINIICSEPETSAPNSSGILLPLNDGTFYDVPMDKLQMWTETFQAVDVVQEFKKMYMWLDANPTRKKTRRGIGRFIFSWLERAQNSGGSRKTAGTNNDFIENMKGWAENE